MRLIRMVALAMALVSVAMLCIPNLALAASQSFGARLIGGEETPSISTRAGGFFSATLNEAETELEYVLVYFELEGTVSVAHIHFGQPGVAGGIVAFLCGGGGKPACPASGTFLTGTVTAADVRDLAAQGFAAGEFSELVRAMRAGLSYANVHSNLFPAGEIRGQIR